MHRADATERLDCAHEARSSTSAAARAQGVPRSTLRGWDARRVRDPDRPVTAHFFETPEGLVVLHRIVLAAQLVFGLMGGAGAGLVQHFLVLAGLAPWVACSERTLDRSMARMVAEVGAWGDATRTQMARDMPLRTIAVALDETWKRGMILVAVDVRSGFLLAEVHSLTRDALAWKTAMDAAFKGLRVRVVHAVADEAQGITTYVTTTLGVLKGADLFHGLYELGPVQRALEAKERQAATALQETRTAQAQARGTPDHGAAVRAHDEARAHARRLHERIETVADCVRGVSAAFHPVDLATGALVSAAAVRARLEQRLARITHAVEASSLRDSMRQRVAKVTRLVPTWEASVAWWHRQLERGLAALKLPAALVPIVREIVVPLAYLEQVARRTRAATARAELKGVCTTLRTRLDAERGWTVLPAEERTRLERWAQAMASWFVRASSCVEGRNGVLALRYHHRHTIPPPVLKALTVVHNFVILRDDGTTAAERFFGSKPGDLFEHLVAVLPWPPRPRRRN